EPEAPQEDGERGRRRGGGRAEHQAQGAEPRDFVGQGAAPGSQEQQAHDRQPQRRAPEGPRGRGGGKPPPPSRPRVSPPPRPRHPMETDDQLSAAAAPRSPTPPLRRADLRSLIRGYCKNSVLATCFENVALALAALIVIVIARVCAVVESIADVPYSGVVTVPV